MHGAQDKLDVPKVTKCMPWFLHIHITCMLTRTNRSHLVTSAAFRRFCWWSMGRNRHTVPLLRSQRTIPHRSTAPSWCWEDSWVYQTVQELWRRLRERGRCGKPCGARYVINKWHIMKLSPNMFEVWVCTAALAILDRLDVIDQDTLAWWLAERQLPNGGLNGRPQKLEDVCYSYWVLSSLSILRKLSWIDSEKLIKFVLSAQVYFHIRYFIRWNL